MLGKNMKILSYVLPFVLLLSSCGGETLDKKTPTNTQNTPPVSQQKKKIPNTKLGNFESDYSYLENYKLVIPELIEDISAFNIKGLEKPICTIDDASLNGFGTDEITLYKDNLFYKNTDNGMVRFDPVKNSKTWVNSDIDWGESYINFRDIADDISGNNSFNLETGKFLIPYSREKPISILTRNDKSFIYNSHNGPIVKYDTKNSKIVWSTELNIPENKYVSISLLKKFGNCLVFIGLITRGKGECMNKYDVEYKHYGFSEYLFGINESTGEMLFSFDSCFKSIFDHGKKRIYIYSEGCLKCYDAVNKKYIWELNLNGATLLDMNDKHALGESKEGYTIYNMMDGSSLCHFKPDYKEYLLHDCSFDETNVTLEIYSDKYTVNNDYCGEKIGFGKLESYKIGLLDGKVADKSIISTNKSIVNELKEKSYPDFTARSHDLTKGFSVNDLDGNLVLETNIEKGFPKHIRKDYFGLYLEYEDNTYTFYDGKLINTSHEIFGPKMWHYEVGNFWLDFKSNESLTVDNYVNKSFAYYFLRKFCPRAEDIFEDDNYLYVDTDKGILVIDYAKDRFSFLDNFVMVSDEAQIPLKTINIFYRRIGNNVDVYKLHKPIRSKHPIWLSKQPK